MAEAEEVSTEVWKNTAAGLRFYLTRDRFGGEATRTVHGNRTFTLTTLERQINQERAANASQDLFRNGNFVLIRKGSATKEDEVASDQSLTDAELLSRVHSVMAKTETIEQVLAPLNDTVVLIRLQEALVLEDAPESAIRAVKEKTIKVKGGPEVRRAEVVSSGGDRVPETGTKQTKVEDDTVSPGREIIPERARG